MSVFAERLAACRERLGGDEAVVCFPSPNLEYLTGFSEEPGERHFLLFATDEAVALLVPALYGDQVRAAVDVGDVRTWADGEDPVDAVRGVAADLGLDGRTVYVDPTMWARFTQDLRLAIRDAEWRLADEVLGPLRVRKDDAEVAAMERAGRAADATVDDLRALGADAVGMTEDALAEWVEERLEANGGTGTSFATIVGSGPNGARPHHHHSDRVVEAGDPVVLDFGTRVEGYPSDQTRTLVFDGEPSEEYQFAHEVVVEAQQAAFEAVAPGVSCEAVDAAAREVIADAGYGDEFIHRTGHGVGLEIHEEPYIVAGNDRELGEGMVFSLEPGIYVEGEWGVRVEDLVVVTEDGADRLNHTDRDWRV